MPSKTRVLVVPLKLLLFASALVPPLFPLIVFASVDVFTLNPDQLQAGSGANPENGMGSSGDVDRVFGRVPFGGGFEVLLHKGPDYRISLQSIDAHGYGRLDGPAPNDEVMLLIAGHATRDISGHDNVFRYDAGVLTLRPRNYAPVLVRSDVSDEPALQLLVRLGPWAAWPAEREIPLDVAWKYDRDITKEQRRCPLGNAAQVRWDRLMADSRVGVGLLQVRSALSRRRHERSHRLYIVWRGTAEIDDGIDRKRAERPSLIRIPPRTAYSIRNIGRGALTMVEISIPPRDSDDTRVLGGAK